MATVRNSIMLQDRMTPILNKVIKSLASTATAMMSIDNVSNASFGEMRADLRAAELAVDKFNQELQETPKKAQESTASLRGMQSPLVNISAAIYAIRSALQGLSRITGISDEFVLTNARLNLMNDKLQTTEELQQKIWQSAQRARAAYDGTAASIAKMGILAGEAFSSNDEIVAFTELMNKSFKLGGAGLQEQTSAMYQLTQAMAAGKLQGDEFRSIMENAPMLAQAIAKVTGKSKGELKEMSSQGVITADIIKAAMFASADDINTKFKEIPRTFGDAWTMMKNQALMAFKPIMTRMNELVNNDDFNEFTGSIVRGLVVVADKMADVFEAGMRLTDWAKRNQTAVSAGLFVIGGILASVVVAQITAAGVAAQDAAIKFLNAGRIFGMSFSSFSVLVAIAAIASLILWIKYLYDTNADFREKVQRIWDDYGALIIGTLSAITLFILTKYLPVMATAAISTMNYALMMAASAKILIADWLALGAAFLLANSWILAVGIAVGVAIYAWNNLGDSGKMLAVVIGAVVTAIGLWTAAQWALNVALSSNPISMVIIAIIAIIAAIAAVAMWIHKLWKTNVDFKYAVIGIWNGILGFFERVPLAFAFVGNMIADTFAAVKVMVITDMEDMANGIIKIINGMISQLNKIPGVAISPLAEMSQAAIVKAEEDAAKQARDASLQAATADVAERSAIREAATAANRIADEAEMAKRAAALEAERQANEARRNEALSGVANPLTAEPDWAKYMDSVKIAGGSLDSIGGIDSSLTLDEDSIKYLKDAAMVEYVNKYTTLKPEMTVNFGDVRETADVRKIMELIEQMVEESYASSLVGEGE